jgi:ABC-2 type transport system ATP-binding protein
MTVIEVSGLVKRYRRAATNAVDGVSFDVERGQLFCLLGPNGAGKTSTVSILTTTLAPSGGRARVAGWDVLAERPRVRQAIGVVFQQPSLDVNLTAEENLRLHAVFYGMAGWRPHYRGMPRGYRARVDELAAVLGLGESLHRPVRTLSGGTRRKLEISRALLHHPQVLFLDEPTTGLDPQARQSLWAHLARIRRDHGITIMLTTHYLAEAEGADLVCVLTGGRVVARASPAQIIAASGPERLLLDAADRPALRRELARRGLPARGDGPVLVPLDGRGVQDVVVGLDIDLCRIELVRPSLEEAYLALLDGAGG